MMFCPGCGTANREGSRFCNECGMRLAQEETTPCPRCGVANPVDVAHCQTCGYDLARAKTSAPAEAGAEPPPVQPPESLDDATPPDEGLPPWLDTAESAGIDDPLRREALDGLKPDADAPEDRPSAGGWSPEAIPIEPVVGVPYRAYSRAQLPPSPEQEQAAALFAALAAQVVHAAPREVPEPKRSAQLGLRTRRLLAAALFLALLVPILWPAAPLGAAPATPAAVAGAAEVIDGIPPGAPVLVAFDYDSSMAGDVQPVAEVYLQHLLSHGLRVVAVSTQPEGAALADMAIDRALAAQEARYGEALVNLGYVAGDEAAVRALAQSVPAAAPTDYRTGAPSSGSRAMQGVGGARELPLIIVLGRDLPAVRRWIEQTATPYGVPLLAGVPALVGPAAEPYRSSGQLRGVVAGVGGAAAYAQLLAGQAPVRSLAALRMGAGVLAAAVVVANLWALVVWVRERRRAMEEA